MPKADHGNHPRLIRVVELVHQAHGVGTQCGLVHNHHLEFGRLVLASLKAISDSRPPDRLEYLVTVPTLAISSGTFAARSREIEIGNVELFSHLVLDEFVAADLAAFVRDTRYIRAALDDQVRLDFRRSSFPVIADCLRRAATEDLITADLNEVGSWPYQEPAAPIFTRTEPTRPDRAKLGVDRLGREIARWLRWVALFLYEEYPELRRRGHGPYGASDLSCPSAGELLEAILPEVEPFVVDGREYDERVLEDALAQIADYDLFLLWQLARGPGAAPIATLTSWMQSYLVAQPVASSRGSDGKAMVS